MNLNSLTLGAKPLGLAMAAAALTCGCDSKPPAQAKDEQLPVVEHWIAPNATERNTYIKATLTARYFASDKPMGEIVGFYNNLADSPGATPASFSSTSGAATGSMAIEGRTPAGATSLFLRRESEMAFAAVVSNAGGTKNAGILLFGKDAGKTPPAEADMDLADLALAGMEKLADGKSTRGSSGAAVAAAHYSANAPISEVWSAYRTKLGVSSTNSWPTDHETMMGAYRNKSTTNWLALPLQENGKVVEKALLQPFESPAKLIYLSRTADETNTHILIVKLN